MFVRIGKSRIKIASIGEFEVDGKSSCTGKWYINIKISGRFKAFTFDSEERMNEVCEYLDKVLKVQEV